MARTRSTVTLLHLCDGGNDQANTCMSTIIADFQRVPLLATTGRHRNAAVACRYVRRGDTYLLSWMSMLRTPPCNARICATCADVATELPRYLVNALHRHAPAVGVLSRIDSSLVATGVRSSWHWSTTWTAYPFSMPVHHGQHSTSARSCAREGFDRARVLGRRCASPYLASVRVGRHEGKAIGAFLAVLFSKLETVRRLNQTVH